MQAFGPRWLSRGDWSRGPGEGGALAAVLDELGLVAPVQGTAALRLWGQTGERPEQWVSAADPVYLEARLDHLRLHALDEAVLSSDERAELFDYLGEHFADSGRRFELVGGHGYLLAEREFATAACPAAAADAGEPQAFLPPAGAAAEHDRLVGELQLLLHDAPLNRRREQQGRAPVNSLWFWGGGHAPPSDGIGLPRLFAGDPLFLGYWRCGGGEFEDWRGAELPQALPPAFVAVLPPAATPDRVHSVVATARQWLMRGRITRLTLVFADGWKLRLRRWHRLAIWRGRRGPLPGENKAR